MTRSKGRDRVNSGPDRLARNLQAIQPQLVSLVESMLRGTEERARAIARKLARQRGQYLPSLQFHDSLKAAKSSPTLAFGLRRVPTSTRVLASSRRLSPSIRIESSDRKMITSVAERKITMRKKKRAPRDIEVPNPLKVNEAEFTDVVRKMVNTEPVTREDVEKRHKLRKNPETDPRYLPVFDFKTIIRNEPKKKT